MGSDNNAYGNIHVQVSAHTTPLSRPGGKDFSVIVFVLNLCRAYVSMERLEVKRRQKETEYDQ